ncbi:MAG: DNA primase [Anaerolineales bacterium]|nr:DNA primase [Anaerolineales bacterium]
MNPVEEIKNRLDIVDIVSESVQLRKSGRSYTGFCPFHSNTKTPSFVVFPESQTWRCFGACADGGDLFSYVMKKNSWDFRETLEQLARRAGVQLEEQTPAQMAQQAAKQEITDLLEAAADYFHQLLLHAPQAEQARQYIAKRELNDKTLDEFRLGYSLNSWDACRNHFMGQGFSEQDLLDAGLLTENPEKGTRYDRFRDRLMFPIRDPKGRTVGFGARTLDPDGIPKYLNSPQTELFDKSHLVYGLDMAKRHVREARQVVIVEGYMDVIQAWQNGFRNVVAQMGTALTEQQLQLLKRYTKRFVIALDADAAGVQATLRSLDVARKALDRELDVQFDAAGLVRHEGRLQADIRIVTMPEGEDPDSMIRREPASWPTLLQKALPIVEYVIGVLTADLDFDDPKAKAAVAQRVIPLIQDVTNPVEREHYWQALGRTLQVDDRALRQMHVPNAQPYQRRAIDQSPAAAKPQPKSGPMAKLQSRFTAVGKREAYFLRACLADPHLLRQVNQRLASSGEPMVDQQDFSAADDRALFDFVGRLTVAFTPDLWDILDQSLHQRVHQLLALSQPPESEWNRLPDRLVLSVLDWRLDKATRLNNEIKQLIKEVSRQRDAVNNGEMIQAYTRQHLELSQEIGRINKAKGSMSAVVRRRQEEGIKH